MTPIAFNENNTHLLNTEMGVVLILLIISCIAGSIHNIAIHNNQRSFFQLSVILQILLSIAAVSSFFFITEFTNKEEQNVEQLMIQQMQEAYEITDLRPTDKIDIFCDDDYSESIDAIIWTGKDGKKEIGLLTGQKIDEECRFLIEETVVKNPMDKSPNE